MSDSVYHIPAMLQATIEALNIEKSGVYADATFGGGGHSRAIMSQLGAEGHLYGFDQDEDARANAIDDDRFTFVHGNFRYMENFLRYAGETRIDGIVADLGVSFHHFDSVERGFSFRGEAPLDMRMNRQSSLTAADIVNEYDEERLTSLFKQYTDLKRPSATARAIISYRNSKPLQSTFELCEAVKSTINPRQEKKDLAQVFQALRIETNAEMDALREFLLSTTRILKPGGRIAVLTYHSIEDRLVKNFLRSGNFDGKLEKDFYGNPITPWKSIKASSLSPDKEEMEANPRSRSAKLRVAELLD